MRWQECLRKHDTLRGERAGGQASLHFGRSKNLRRLQGLVCPENEQVLCGGTGDIQAGRQGLGEAPPDERGTSNAAPRQGPDPRSPGDALQQQGHAYSSSVKRNWLMMCTRFSEPGTARSASTISPRLPSG